MSDNLTHGSSERKATSAAGASAEHPWSPTSDPASWACYVGLRMTEYGGTKRVVVSSIRDGYVWTRDLEDSEEGLRDLIPSPERTPRAVRDTMPLGRIVARKFWTKGTRIRKADGRAYIRCRDQSVMSYARGALAAALGRELRPDEHVHHLNGDCTDDRLTNLAVIGAAEHARLHGHSWRTSRWSERTCKGCGCDHDLVTDGCGLCRNRMRLRRYREERRAS